MKTIALLMLGGAMTHFGAALAPQQDHLLAGLVYLVIAAIWGICYLVTNPHDAHKEEY